MTFTSLIKFAPLTTLERVNDPRWSRPGRTMYDAGALTLLPGRPSVPVLVNHDKTRVIGAVTSLTRFEDVDGPWLAALAQITDRPPWLERGCRCSFGYGPAGTGQFAGCEILRRGVVTEVSVLSPGVEPAEPLAQVLTIHPTETPKPAPTVIHRSLAPAARRITPEDEVAEFVRRLDWYGPDVPAELIREHMERELNSVR